MNPLKIHFPCITAERPPFDIACALGAGGYSPVRERPGPEEHKLDQLNEEAPRWFTATSLDEAEIVVYPHRAQDNLSEVVDVAEQAKARGLPCIFLSWGDGDVSIPVPHGIVYRHSLFADRRLKHEFAMPALCADPLPDGGRGWAPRPRQQIPTVGFCGFVSSPWKRALYRMMGRKEKACGLLLRAKALASLRKCPKVKTNFICRDAYWAGTVSRFHRDTGGQFKARSEFLENLVGTDYTVCARGAGNFSYRLYESLAAGRIPLFINTRCVLPFEDKIDWKHHCVWVEETQIPEAGEILAAFHAKLSDKEFEALQAENRSLWQQKLCNLGFYRQALDGAVAGNRGIAASHK